MILYALMFLSVFLETSRNVFSNNFSKNCLKTTTDIYKFNFFMYIGSVFVLSFFKSSGTSLFSISIAFLFALAIWLNQFFMLKALNCGSMSFTIFIQGTNLLVPIIFGLIVWNKKITYLQILMIIILLFGMALALNLSKKGLNFKWFLYSFLAMFFVGVIGIIQTVQQNSNHSVEVVSFLRYSFVFTVIINFIGWQITERKEKASFSIKTTAIIQAILAGAFMGLVHINNIYLVGKVPIVIFFPIINGGNIFVTLISDLIFFKERLNIKQWCGIIIGTSALCILGI